MTCSLVTLEKRATATSARTMGTALVVVESGAKAKTIEKFLGSDFRVMASGGHVRDLPARGLSVDIENGFRPQFEVVASTKKNLDALKRVARKASRIYLATDPDREGEADQPRPRRGVLRRARPEEPDADPADRVPRDHPAGDPPGDRGRRGDRRREGPGPADAPGARPHRGLQDLAAAVPKGRAAPLGRAGPVGRPQADLRPRARDPRVRHRGVLDDRGAPEHGERRRVRRRRRSPEGAAEGARGPRPGDRARDPPGPRGPAVHGRRGGGRRTGSRRRRPRSSRARCSARRLPRSAFRRPAR